MSDEFVFNGVSSSSFEVEVFFSEVDNGVAEEYDKLTVPGRNGDLLIDQKRRPNKPHIYSGIIYKNFSANYKNFKEYLLSQIGYKRLTDTFHPNEFYHAVFDEELEVIVDRERDMGKFKLEFNRKPQRFLLSGEEVTTFLAGEQQTETFAGNPASFETGGQYLVTKLSANISPTQSGSGTPAIDNYRPISGTISVNFFVSPTTVDSDGQTIHASLPGTVYFGELDIVSGKLSVTHKYIEFDGNTSWITSSSVTGRYLLNNADSSGIVKSQTDFLCSHFQPSASSSAVGTVYVSTGPNVIFNTSFATLAEWKAYLGGQASAGTPVQCLCRLVTPLEYQLTPQEIHTLAGQNYVWSDAGAVEGEYITPSTIENPTRFESQPLIRVYGTGILGVNGDSVVISQADQYTDIDCELMDAYKGLENRNQYVTLTNYNFPVLKPGTNYISLGGNITRVEITPRWWTI